MAAAAAARGRGGEFRAINRALHSRFDRSIRLPANKSTSAGVNMDLSARMEQTEAEAEDEIEETSALLTQPPKPQIGGGGLIKMQQFGQGRFFVFFVVSPHRGSFAGRHANKAFYGRQFECCLCTGHSTGRTQVIATSYRAHR